MKRLFFRKSCNLWDNIRKYRSARQATDSSIIRLMRIECRIPKARDPQPAYVTLITLPQEPWLRERA